MKQNNSILNIAGFGKKKIMGRKAGEDKRQVFFWRHQQLFRAGITQCPTWKRQLQAALKGCIRKCDGIEIPWLQEERR